MRTVGRVVNRGEPSAASNAAASLRRRSRRLAGRGLHAARWRVRRLTYRSTGPCRWLPPDLTLDEFFDTLRRHQVTYTVLRWFEALPEVEPGHDVDVLVSDEHVDFVQSLLANRPRKGAQHFDVYSASGLPGSDLDGTPCFPPHLAHEILTNAVWLRGAYRVPGPEPHFLGLADLADRLGEPLEPTLDGLDRYLAARGLRPAPDALRSLARTNRWIADRFGEQLPDVDRPE